MTSVSGLGRQQLLSGILRGDGQMTLVFNSSTPISLLAFGGILAGQTGVLSIPFGSTLPFTVPCLITEVLYVTKVEDKVEVTVSARLNVLANANGAYTRIG